MNVLVFSTLYPNAEQIRHGIFVEQRLRHLLAQSEVRAQVLAPVPWFPIKHTAFGRYARLARVPKVEERHGIRVSHPRYPVIPKVGMSVAPLIMAAALLGKLRGLRDREFSFDLIDAHYFYPDGVAAVLLGRRLGRPVLVTARGTDLNQIARYPGPKRWIQWAASRAGGLITVSTALRDVLIGLGADPDRVRVLRNGVDTELFRATDRENARRRLSVEGPTLLSVGNLVAEKGLQVVLRALPLLPEASLIVVGEGPEEAGLRRLARELGVAERIRYQSEVPQEDLHLYYSAADALVLASYREGWPNVLLEAMACGTPVVARAVGGTPEIVTAPEAGLLQSGDDPEAWARGIRSLLNRQTSRAATRAYAERFGWEETSRGQRSFFEEVLAAR